MQCEQLVTISRKKHFAQPICEGVFHWCISHKKRGGNGGPQAMIERPPMAFIRYPAKFVRFFARSENIGQFQPFAVYLENALDALPTLPVK
jgi:hypothetical protein